MRSYAKLWVPGFKNEFAAERKSVILWNMVYSGRSWFARLTRRRALNSAIQHLPSRQVLADGRPITLGDRTIDVLMALIEASGAVVSKDELLNRV